ncbi:2-dehydro-3-deoxygalactonokinase [Prosthecomicrobium sp. N25]|uniref:2-dehydro-3-deoxygalactonokinase n=1 Tax=Prosthecomicrobium sp. N25 TaxID=3129254 RepID=UPI003076D6EE
MTETPHLIAVDWGTSSFRAALLAGDGRAMAEAQGPDGITRVPDRAFAATLFRHVGPWLDRHGPLPVLLSGMIGSRNGWVEVPHVPCPAGFADLARGTRRVEDRVPLVFVSGLSSADSDGLPDVMRGEEVQIFGAAGGLHDAEVVLPGSHSKWARLRDGRVAGFATHMTGELFAAIRHHTIIGQLAEGDEPDPEAFAAGVERTRRDPALAHAVFTARTLPLAGRLPAHSVSAYLSGILIGAELAAALPGLDRSLPAVVVGDPRLAALYRDAARLFGLDLAPGPADAAFRGLFALARAMELVP